MMQGKQLFHLRALRDQRTDRQGRPGRLGGPGPDLLHRHPAPHPPHRHRDGGLSPLTAGLTSCPASSPTSPATASHHAANVPAPGRSNAGATTATGSSGPTSRPAPATTSHPRFGCTRSPENPHDQLRLRGIGPRSDDVNGRPDPIFSPELSSFRAMHTFISRNSLNSKEISTTRHWRQTMPSRSMIRSRSLEVLVPQRQAQSYSPIRRRL